MCKGKKCLAPTPCPALEVDHMEYLGILRKLRELDGVKKVFIRSGIRYDYLLLDKDDTFLRELVKYHVSGQLKVAPEHCSAAVLDRMGKPHIESYKEFSRRYFAATGQAHKEQYLVPYLMSSHPGSTLHEAIELALFLKREHIRPSRCRISTPPRERSRPVCFIPGWILIPWSLFMFPKVQRKKGCSVRFCSTINPRTGRLSKKRSDWPGGQT